MKVEKINDNKIKITLSLEELEKRKISLTDLEHDSSLAKNLFLSLIEESDLEDEFKLENSQLFIEAFSDNNNTFVITITKIDAIPELLKYNNENMPIKNKVSTYKVESNIFEFENLDKILSMCAASKNENLFFGRNSLYKLNDRYFIIFKKSSVKNKKFIKTFIFLSEYCTSYYNDEIFEASLIEKSTNIIKSTALQKLSNF